MRAVRARQIRKIAESTIPGMQTLKGMNSGSKRRQFRTRLRELTKVVKRGFKRQYTTTPRFLRVPFLNLLTGVIVKTNEGKVLTQKS